MEDELIHHVSDTALWIAGYRAQESARNDAVFKDPLAEKLAGEQGKQMVATTPHTEQMAFAMVTRTTAIDRLVYHAIEKGIDTVINLGAGLDTRPYRMNLPIALRWIEVDFQHMINYKSNLLKDNNPVCNLERIAFDLSKTNERKILFEGLGKQTKRALVITEGVIAYLTNEQAAKLSKDLFEVSSFYYWIQDYNQGRLRKNRFAKDLRKKLVHAPLQFNEKDPLNFFSKDGWVVDENIHILDEADRIGRKLPLELPLTLLKAIFPNKIRELGNKTYGYVMFRRP
jgi:methyltransferase (TIGR00027 family)